MTKVKSNENVHSSVLGTFEGQCADADITNKNGLDITREVWQYVFSSEDYKQAIDLGWYIGFLGHPEDPGCMDFEHACIVMREGHLDDDGKVYGRFELIDTPVGRIVKAFIDAGVTFGISVRGAGDIVANSVDPETFVFRGFDLVSFPAYPEAIPTFSAVAASTDVEKQQRYKIACDCVRNNLDSITSASAVKVLKSQFAKQSEEYKLLDEKEKSLEHNSSEDEPAEDISEQKIEAMTDLYLSEKRKSDMLSAELAKVRIEAAKTASAAQKKLSRVKLLASTQMDELTSMYEACQGELNETKNKLDSSEKANLKYKQRVDSATSSLKAKDKIIASLKAELSKTVEECDKVKSRVSDLDASNQSLQRKVQASEKLVKEYQQAYANFYSSAAGIKSSHVNVSSNTSVADLRKILGGTSCEQPSNVFVRPDQVEILDEDDNQDDLVTL